MCYNIVNPKKKCEVFIAKTINMIDAGFIAVGTAYSLANIETILGVIILCIQLAWIITKCVYKFIQFIKGKISPAELGKDIQDNINEIKSIREEVGNSYGINDKKE